MAHRVLELTLVSAENLKDVNVFSRMEVYGVVSVNGTRLRTKTDRDGARHPRWDETLSFIVPPTAAAASASGGAYVRVLLRTERLFSFSDGDVGEVYIRLADLLAGACDCGAATACHCASYPVRKVQSRSGRGMLNVSYSFGPMVAPPLPNNECYPPPWQCYPPSSFPRTLPAPKPVAGGGAAAASTATKNVRKNSSYTLVGAGVGLPGGSETWTDQLMLRPGSEQRQPTPEGLPCRLAV